MRNFISNIIVSFTALLFFNNTIQAQSINWENISQRNMLHGNFGADYGIVAGLGYHRIFPAKKFPLLLGGDFSMPFGKNIADDFKLRLGVHMRMFEVSGFQLAVRVQGVARRYQNSSLTLFNFGSDVGATAGYYCKRWFVAAETGFDKAIVTHFKHSQWYKENIYEHVQDGWFAPATGGNFYYGLQGGYSLKKVDITLKAGKLLQQDFKSQPLIPFSGELGVNLRF